MATSRPLVFTESFNSLISLSISCEGSRPTCGQCVSTKDLRDTHIQGQSNAHDFRKQCRHEHSTADRNAIAVLSHRSTYLHEANNEVDELVLVQLLTVSVCYQEADVVSLRAADGK